jgi:predicted GNAT superfamily acetyltransferase
VKKVFYISENSETGKSGGVSAPSLDRFQRVEKLNEMLSRGWQIKEFKNSDENSYFVLEKSV